MALHVHDPQSIQLRHLGPLLHLNLRPLHVWERESNSSDALLTRLPLLLQAHLDHRNPSLMAVISRIVRSRGRFVLEAIPVALVEIDSGWEYEPVL